MLDWIKKAFSDSDGLPDDARVAAFLVVLAFIGCSISGVVMSPAHAFDAQAFGIGAGSMSAGIGVWFGQRRAN